MKTIAPLPLLSLSRRTLLKASGAFLITATLTGHQGAASAADDVIRIGAPLPVTGALSPEGTKLRQGYDLWLEQVNAHGGIKVGNQRRKVELVFGDYQSNTPRAVQLAEKMIVEDKVNFLFSPFGSGATKAVSSVAEKYGTPMIASSASSNEVFNQGYKNLFGIYTDNSTLSEPIATLVRAKGPQIRRVAILARNDLYPLSLANEFEKSARKRGFEVVYFERYPIGTLDHAAAISQLRNSKPDWVIVTGYINDLILVRKQLADQKVTTPALTMINGPAYQEWAAASGDLAENVTTASWFHSVLRYKSNDLFGSTERFVKLFRDKYKADPDFTQASGAGVGVLLQLAIERAGSIDHEKVRAALRQGNFATFFGPLSFDATGIANSYTPPVFQIQNRKVAVVYPSEVKTADFQLGTR
ncbi:ABC transporter substrate-binding protein [Noviherbaspirillum cavernae]|uniref:ABC transporter substrate-binding protein n=1 Tax=Noviherbaspirillum cavernae TaxID=2320862 RepID=A0A418X5I0_9BURK|nr:amino acid ABC transporter substrate-binding protein [Noviherbaspirillum cavernae]RJG07744.1 ABC transporter substrate-binding protein [Noviherbaspirillum cavernae]